jgi:hypothetical protein
MQRFAALLDALVYTTSRNAQAGADRRIPARNA